MRGMQMIRESVINILPLTCSHVVTWLFMLELYSSACFGFWVIGCFFSEAVCISFLVMTLVVTVPGTGQGCLHWRCSFADEQQMCFRRRSAAGDHRQRSSAVWTAGRCSRLLQLQPVVQDWSSHSWDMGERAEGCPKQRPLASALPGRRWTKRPSDCAQPRTAFRSHHFLSSCSKGLYLEWLIWGRDFL